MKTNQSPATTAARYAIVRTRSFYYSGDKRDRHEGPDATWTLGEARREIACLNSGTYYQSHNEYGRPAYRAVRVDLLPQYLR